MGSFDLSSANMARVAGQEVDLLRIANQIVWQKPSGPPAQEHVFTTQTPSASFTDGPVTLGTLFRPSVAGTIDGIRFWAPPQAESGRIGALYQVIDDAHGTQIGENLPLVTTVDSNWNQTLFPSPIPVGANTYWIVAVYYPRYYVAASGFFATGPGSAGITNGHLFAPQSGFNGLSNGKFAQAAGGPFYPNSSFNGNCYFVDPLFTPS